MPSARSDGMTYAEVNLEGVVDEPLEGLCELARSTEISAFPPGAVAVDTYGEGADHEYPDGKTVPEAAEADIAVNPSYRLACALTGFAVGVQFRYHYIFQSQLLSRTT